MLKKFTVQGYRNFSCPLSIDFSNVRDYRFNENALQDNLVKCGVMYGKNAVGKTNLCRALMDIRNNIGRGYHTSDETNFLTADGLTESALFEYIFKIKENEFVYSYRKTNRKKLLEERLVLNGAVVFDYENDTNVGMVDQHLELVGADQLNWAYLGADQSILNYICNTVPAEVNNPIIDLYDFILNIHPIHDALMVDYRFINDVIDRVITQGNVAELQSFLNSFGIYEKLVVLDSPSGAPVLYFDKERPVPFIENCSSGTIALLRLFNYFNSVNGSSFLFVDEFDAFYHHDLAEGVINYFKGLKGLQVLCASHNTDLFSNKILRPDCLFILSDSGFTSAADATRRELREGNNLEKLYKAGEFDG